MLAFYKLGHFTWVSDLRTPSLLLADCDCREFKQWQKLAIVIVTLQNFHILWKNADLTKAIPY